VSVETILEVEGLAKRYEGFALENVSFRLPRGHVMGLIGPNGAGKTTTLRLLLGLVRPSGGRIRMFGDDPSLHGAALRRRMGFVQDEPRFYRHLSLAANAGLVRRFYPTWSPETFRRLAAQFGLPLRKRFGRLSRGNRTRFALAVALSHRAELILMDEPTTGLDPVFRRELLDELGDVLHQEEASILFSTHITADLDRLADYVTLLQRGRVVFSAEKDRILDGWGLVKGGNELLEGLPSGFFRGIRRGRHGFEALTDDAAAARARFGAAAIVERPTLEDVVLHTTAEAIDA
jgi:ABC-2 type transport system ATP-binding protein